MTPDHIARVRMTLASLPTPAPDAPWSVLFSGCLAGLPCGVAGNDYGMGDLLTDVLRSPAIRPVWFCPENAVFGTPRATPDLHGGDGFDVLDGAARVRFDDGTDVTDALLRGAREMVSLARAHNVVLALLTDMSAACGTQVIPKGCRFDAPRRYRWGPGVAAAALIRAGIPVCSQRDHQTLGLLRARLDPAFVADPGALDHHDHPWVRANLPTRERRS